MLSVERTPAFTVISKVPTIILGMDVSHGSPGQSDVPSIAAVRCLLYCILYIVCYCIGPFYLANSSRLIFSCLFCYGLLRW